MPNQNQCGFRIDGKECPKMRDSDHVYCSEHKTVFASIDNPALIEDAARSMREMTYVSKDKKITATSDPKLIDAFVNRLQELLARGYTHQEATNAIGDVIQEKGIIDDQLKQIGKDPKWKKFEKIVAGIHMLQAEGAEVKFNDHIVGKKTNSSRQLDVSIRFKHSFYDYLTIVECKDTGRRVEVKEVEAFSKKMEDVGARHGVMVSPHGFQKGGVGTAEFENIELFTLTEIKSDWTKQIKANVFTLPFPESVEFDYPYFDASPLAQEPMSINYGQVVFYRGANEPALPLTQVLWESARYVVKKELTLPQRVKITFEPPRLYQFPGTTFFTPIYAVIINFEPSKFAVGYEIDMPPKLVSYRYSDLKEKRVHEFSAKEIPKV
jgi:hypothetical protein